MVSKRKRALALVLTGMMAAAALAGCTDGGGSTTTSSSTPATQNSSAGGSEGSTDAAATTDILSDAMVNDVKDMLASEAKDGKITLKVWCSSSDLQFEKWLKDQFIERYSDSRYELKITPSSVEEPDVSSKLQADVSKGADVFSFPDDQLRTLVDTGCIAQVSSILNENVKKENTDASVEVCSIDGVPYAFPKTSDNGYFLYYDKRVFSDDDIKTFDGIISKANSQNKNVLFAMDNAWYNAGFFFTAGCESSYDGKTQTTDFDSDKGLSAVKAMAHICESAGSGFIGSGGDADVLAGFQNGTIAAAVTGTWNGPGIKEAIGEENVGATKLPTILINGEQQQLCSFGGYKVEGVRANTEFPTAAQVYAYYVTSEQSQLYRYGGANVVKGKDKDGNDKVLSRGFIPTNKAALETEDLKKDEAAIATNEQRPYSKPQSIVGGKFWSPQGNLGGSILAAKGNLSEDEMKTQLKDTVTAFNKASDNS